VEVKFPNVKVKLIGSDGNAFAILAKVSGAMRQAGIAKESIDEYLNESTSGDYNHLLATAMRTVEVS